MGITEDLMAFGRNLAILAGWSRPRLTDFLNLSDAAEQVEYWDRWLDTPKPGAPPSIRCSLRACWGSLMPVRLSSLPQDFGYGSGSACGDVGCTPTGNPYASSLLLGKTGGRTQCRVYFISIRLRRCSRFPENVVPRQRLMRSHCPI